MNAAVVRAFDRPPRYETFEAPVAHGDNEAFVDVLAAALHPRVRSGAAGSHYTSTGQLPLIPGVDGVGRLANGQQVYFVAADDTYGTMAEQALIDLRQSVPLPAGANPVTIAAAMLPGMSSWLALRKRIHFEAGQRVLILGATGNAGQLAIQIARYLGAAQVIAAGRDADVLPQLTALGADSVLSLAGDLSEAAAAIGEAAAEVDVVIDYVWGQPAERIMPAILTRRADRSRALDWIQIGSMAGATITLPSEVLRAANLRVQGSGQGSISTRDIVGELPSLVKALADGTFKVNAKAVPLSEVESAWNAPTPRGQTLVFTP